MSIASLVTDKNASNATDAEPVELVPPVPLAAAPAGPGPEFAPMPAPAAAPMAAPAPAPAPAKTSGLWSWLPWFLSPSSLVCQNMPKSAWSKCHTSDLPRFLLPIANILKVCRYLPDQPQSCNTEDGR